MKIFQKEILTNQEHFAISRFNYSLWKKMLFSTMGGFFIGLAYIGYLMIIGSNSNSELKGVMFFLASLVFPVGIIMCVFLGGNLYTSNSLIFIGVAKGKIKWYLFLLDLFITLIFNAVGSMIIAGIALGSGIFINLTDGTLNNVGRYAVDLGILKINSEWWRSILSAIICNILVTGSAFAFVECKDKVLGFILMYLMIFLFAISGTQHIVANFFIISESGFLSLHENKPWANSEIAKIFYNNLIPSAIGNLIGGVSLSTVYLLSSSLKKTKFDSKISVGEENKEETRK